MNAEVDALVAKWREDADESERIGYVGHANRLRDCADELAALAARPAAPPVGEAERLRAALVKVRMHTAYLPTAPSVLLAGLLASIERITDAALAPPAPPVGEAAATPSLWAVEFQPPGQPWYLNEISASKDEAERMLARSQERSRPYAFRLVEYVPALAFPAPQPAEQIEIDVLDDTPSDPTFAAPAPVEPPPFATGRLTLAEIQRKLHIGTAQAMRVQSALYPEPPPARYCRECGSERLAYVEQYASGEEWRCKDCGTVAMQPAKGKE